MSILDPLEVILHTRVGGGSTCEGFSGVRSVRPAWIVVLSEGSSEADTLAGELADALRAGLLTLQPVALQPSVPCGGVMHDLRCGAEDEWDCIRLLVWVGATNPSADAVRELFDWLGRPGPYEVLPVLNSGLDPYAVLPSPIQHLNASRFDMDIGETVLDVFRASGIAPTENRVFISYKTEDGGSLADSLFDALAHAGFDVFLDRFRLNPGVDFEVRLFEELADKAMVVVVESPLIATSPWVGMEVAFSKKHLLGLVALHAPDAGRAPVPSHQRMTLGDDEVQGSFAQGDLKLTAKGTVHIVDHLRRVHAAAINRRELQLRLSTLWSLLWSGVAPADIALSMDGFDVTSASRSYAISLSPRPAQLEHFYRTERRIAGSGRDPAVVSPVAGLGAGRRSQLVWLAEKAGVSHFDVTGLGELANLIAVGREL
ncbi:MAG: toll/interleukin-1 receptor domain-containing protein [Actinobacteria bacterium]|nr:toll/interleukin-1 receptor domain-containing protein [Actinomycetota bacterium]